MILKKETKKINQNPDWKIWKLLTNKSIYFFNFNFHNSLSLFRLHKHKLGTTAGLLLDLFTGNKEA